MIRIPTHLIDSMTMSAISTANRFSNSIAGMWRLVASVRCMLTAFNLLNAKNQNTSVTAKISTRYTISRCVILKISPTNRLEYLLKFPPFERIASPIATEQEEKTDMIVSVPYSYC